MDFTLQLSAFFLLLFSAIVSAESFSFTQPSPNEKLNLSSPIQISWTKGQISYAAMDLLWDGSLEGGTTFTYTLEQNITLSADAGSYTWDPANVTKALDSENNTLTSGKDFYFQVEFHEVNQTWRQSTQSEGYAVTGYDHIASAGPTVAVPLRIAIWPGIVVLTILNAWWF